MFSLRESFPYEFPQIINIPVTEIEFICAISSLKNKTSCGPFNKILKVPNSQISKPTTDIYNKSLVCAICPNRLKYAIIKPCFKKGDKSQVPNCRPVSLLTSVSKIFELLIFHRLQHHLVTNYILVNEQFSFSDNVSTDSAILNSLS